MTHENLSHGDVSRSSFRVHYSRYIVQEIAVLKLRTWTIANNLRADKQIVLWTKVHLIMTGVSKEQQVNHLPLNVVHAVYLMPLTIFRFNLATITDMAFTPPRAFISHGTKLVVKAGNKPPLLAPQPRAPPPPPLSPLLQLQPQSLFPRPLSPPLHSPPRDNPTRFLEANGSHHTTAALVMGKNHKIGAYVLGACVSGAKM